MKSLLDCKVCVLLMIAGFFSGFPGRITAQGSSPHPSLSYKSLIAAWDEGRFSAKRPGSLQWFPSGERYTVLEPAQAPAKGRDLVAYDVAAGGQRTVLVPASWFAPEGASQPLAVEAYQWSGDGKQLLVFTGGQKVWRQRTRGDYWVLDLRTHSLLQLGGKHPASSLMFAKFSPDSKQVAYVRENNIYVEDLASHDIRALTTDGSADVSNGTSDWVNEEELGISDAFRWSPDSTSIAFWQYNQSGVQKWTLLDETSGAVPVAREYHYPQAGTTNSATRIGVVPISNPFQVMWLPLPEDPREHYIPHMDWVPHTRRIAVEYLDRLQRKDLIYLAEADSGKLRQIFEDVDSKYVDTIAFHSVQLPDFTWLPAKGQPDGEPAALLWYSERDGWRHAYSISLNSSRPTSKLLTRFSGDVIAPVAVDVEGGSLFFTASPGDPIRSYLYRSSLDGIGEPQRLTATTESGTHAFALPSPDGHYAIETFGTANQPATYALTRLSDGRRVQMLRENSELTRKIAALESAIEFTNTPISEGLSLSTMVIKPPHFDPSKKYPVFTMVYGEAADQTVVDRFGGWDLFLIAVAREGYVVLSFDNQGTPSPRGHDWRHADYGAIGVLSTKQQAEAIRAFAASHAFVDLTRLAMWGWSAGGTNTLNMLFRYPGLYSTGISVAPMPDHKRYDTIYKERYMGLPSANEQGYHDGSPINYTQGLTGNLLIIHGSGDDNDHFAATEDLVNRLIAQGKVFDLMVYPGRSHDIDEGPGTFLHVMSLTTRYLEDHVPAGPR